MHAFEYRADELWCEAVRLSTIATEHGTPTYVYSAASIGSRYAALDAALASVPHRICYAVKTNSNLAILGTLARAGAGFDIVSGGELHRLMRVGVDPARIVFAGVGKSADEMRAALAAGIGTFNIESRPEAEALSRVATAAGLAARVALRVNPDVQAGGHSYVATGTAAQKFGVPWTEAVEIWEYIARLPGLVPVGLHGHVGSQILDVGVYRDVAARLAELALALRSRGHSIESLNVGGGLGIRYHDEVEPDPAAFAAAVLPVVRALGVELVVEPGRFLVGNAGVLLTRVVYRKQAAGKVFVIVDAGMNDLMRPSLYDAHHEIVPLCRNAARRAIAVDVVGPLCESGDFLARGRMLPDVEAGEYLAVRGAGAYGFVMASNYNSRPRPAEVLVSGGVAALVRARESLDDLIRGEQDWTPSPSMS